MIKRIISAECINHLSGGKNCVLTIFNVVKNILQTTLIGVSLVSSRGRISIGEVKRVTSREGGYGVEVKLGIQLVGNIPGRVVVIVYCSVYDMGGRQLVGNIPAAVIGIKHN